LITAGPGGAGRAPARANAGSRRSAAPGRVAAAVFSRFTTGSRAA
jgi:hypothetical protein